MGFIFSKFSKLGSGAKPLAGDTALSRELRAAPRAASMEQYFIFSLSIFSLPAIQLIQILFQYSEFLASNCHIMLEWISINFIKINQYFLLNCVVAVRCNKTEY